MDMDKVVIKLLALAENCGDTSGDDGEYLSDQVWEIIREINLGREKLT